MPAVCVQAVRSDVNNSQEYMDWLTLLLLGSEIMKSRGLENQLNMAVMEHSGPGGLEQLLSTACGIGDVD
jgi:hypothetical protein